MKNNVIGEKIVGIPIPSDCPDTAVFRLKKGGNDPKYDL